MKKMLVLGVLALSVLAVSGREASAWTKFKFGIGANISYIGAGNSILWGAFCGQQMPPNGGQGANPYAPFPVGYGDYGAAGYAGGQQNTNPPSAPTQVQPAAYYPQAGYYYPQLNYGYYPAPSYWYGW
jgi:hypothetical protein